LLTLINGWDPVGRLEAGAPRDEYDRVVDQLLKFLSQEPSRTEVAAFLDREISAHFGAKPRDVDAFANRALVWYEMLRNEQGD
jgi:hypothetical protein